MAFSRYATATIVTPHVSHATWRKTTNRVASSHAASVDLIAQASGIFESEFNPEQYLLTHATIVASVNTVVPPNTKTGTYKINGFKVNRKFADYRIDPECTKFINNNHDCWSRGVLLASYKTFVGGHNFVEHVQIEDLSKGRIIDAVARDIGPSIYTDILIATDRKHKDLVASIESGEMSTLSMGCTVDFTICTKCGHVAHDETEMCPCIKYEKGNTFHDEQGYKHRVAELCGHASVDPNGGVRFIEASWVKTPAFTGAVMRNILTPTAEMARQAERILSTPPPQWSGVSHLVTASVKSAEFGFGEEEESAPAEETPKKTPLEDAEEKLTQHLMDRVEQRIRKQLEEKEKGPVPSESTTAPNDSIQREASQMQKRTYVAAINVMARTASSDAALVEAVAEFHSSIGVPVPVPLYRAALKVGSLKQYEDQVGYRDACRVALGREPTPSEFRTLVGLGQILSRRQSASESIYGSRQHRRTLR